MKLQYTINKFKKTYTKREEIPISLKHVHLKPGYKLSVYQFDIWVRVRTWYYRGKTVPLEILLGGAIFLGLDLIQS